MYIHEITFINQVIIFIVLFCLVTLITLKKSLKMPKR